VSTVVLISAVLSFQRALSTNTHWYQMTSTSRLLDLAIPTVSGHESQDWRHPNPGILRDYEKSLK